MKTINTGNEYRFYDDSVKTYDKLPAQTYTVAFHPKMGFWLEKHPDLTINEKIYGSHMQKVDKVLHSFEIMSRSLGVILSGDKGIGKSLFARKVAISALELGYPIIIVNSYIPGIADFLNSIEEDAVILFDEFDKTFYNGDRNIESNSVGDPQTEMLSLFDGLSVSKKLFIVTCNKIGKLNDFLVNRPGRFHYHFRFNAPEGDEIRIYLKDNIPEEFHSEIEKVVEFAVKIDLNYDCLRAIAFELSLGYSFEEAIKDLNILNIEELIYNVTVYFENGDIFDAGRMRLDLMRAHIESSNWCYYKNKQFQFLFNSSKVNFDPFNTVFSLKGEDIEHIDWDEDYFESAKERDKFAKENCIKYINFKRDRGKELHFAV